MGSGIGNFDELYNTVVAYEKGVRIFKKKKKKKGVVIYIYFRTLTLIETIFDKTGLQKGLPSICTQVANQLGSRPYLNEIRIHGKLFGLLIWELREHHSTDAVRALTMLLPLHALPEHTL